MQKTCIVIPCYNEESRFPLKDFMKFFHDSDIYFCLVNDGSKDGTINLLKEISLVNEERIKVINLEANQGKAEAVRRGMLESSNWKEFSYIGFFDADLSTPLNQVYLLLNEIQKPEALMAVGSRVKLMGRNIQRSLPRHYFGRIFSTASSTLLSLPVYDTQCGAKIFRAEFINNLFSNPFLSRWLFDVEIFARIIGQVGKVKAEKIIVEVPLETWIEIGESKLSFGYFFKVPLELIKIYKRYYKDLKK